MLNHRTLKIAWLIATGITLLGAIDNSSLAAAPRVSDLKVFFREGQSFLTWCEDDSVSGEWYRVYTSAKPITKDSLAEATFIAKIPEGSRESTRVLAKPSIG